MQKLGTGRYVVHYNCHEIGNKLRNVAKNLNFQANSNLYCYLGSRPVSDLEHRAGGGNRIAKHDVSLHAHRLRGWEQERVPRVSRPGGFQGIDNFYNLMRDIRRTIKLKKKKIILAGTNRWIRLLETARRSKEAIVCWTLAQTHAHVGSTGWIGELSQLFIFP